MGLPIMLAEFSAKRLELLKTRCRALRGSRFSGIPPPHTIQQQSTVSRRGAPSMGIGLSFIEVRTPEQIDSASSTLIVSRAEALHVLDCPLFILISSDSCQARVQLASSRDLGRETIRQRRSTNDVRGGLRGPDTPVAVLRRQNVQKQKAQRLTSRTTNQIRW